MLKMALYLDYFFFKNASAGPKLKNILFNKTKKAPKKDI